MRAVLSFVLLFFLGYSLWGTEIPSVDPYQLRDMLTKNSVELIDVREVGEFNEERIEGARNIPLSILSADQIPSTDKTIVIQCKSGKRGEAAYKLLKNQKPILRLYNLKGGILRWKRDGLPTM